jgi:hypothetical protein
MSKKRGGPQVVEDLIETGDVKLGKADKTPPYEKSITDIEQEIYEKLKADNEKAVKAFESRNTKKLDEFNLSEDDPIGDLEKIIKDEGETGLPKKPRDEKYTGGLVDVEPSLSDIGHGSDALMARTRLVSPGSQTTTSTGLNYLLAEDNDNIRVPFQDGLSAAKKFGNILVADETLSERAGKELESKMSEFIPNETQKEKEEKEMFEMIKDFQKFKRENPDSRMTYERYVKEKKKEKELFKNTILDLAVKYPEKKVINEAGFVDKKNLKEAIDKAELDLEISPIDGLTLKRSIDTEGEQSVTSGTFDINNFSFSSPNLEEGILTSKGDFDIGDLNLSATIDSKDSDILKSGIAFNYDDILKGELSESDGYKEGELNLNKTFPINDKFNLNLKGGSDIMITPDGKTYKSSDLTPKLSYDDGILSASIAKEIMEGGNEPNLSAGINYNDFYLKGDNLLSKKDRSGIFGYQKEYGDKDGDAFFTIGGEKNIYDDDYTIGVGGKYKFADGGRIGFSKGKLADAARRKFLKTASSVGAGIAALKTGLLGFGKEAAPVVEKVAETVSQTAQSVPPYFFRLVEKIRAMGDETMASQDKAIAKKYKDYVMEEDFAGNITITKSGEDLQGNKLEDVYMSYKVDDVALKDKDGFARVDEYEEFTARPDMEGKMKDVEPGVPDEVIEEAGDIDAMTLKKASGGIARMIGE